MSSVIQDRFDQFFPDGVIVTDLEGIIQHGSLKCLDFFGLPQTGSLMGMLLYDLLAGKGRVEAADNFNRLLHGKPVTDNVYCFRRSDQTSFFGALSSGLIRDEEGAPTGFIHTLRDITGRWEAMTRLNRALLTLSEINQALVRIGEEQELMDRICEILVTIGGYRMCWVGFAQHDDQKSVRPVAQKGFDEGYLNGITLSWDDNSFGHGPTGTSIRMKKTIIARNIPDNPGYLPWREAAIRQGYVSSIALPLFTNNGMIGALNIYSGSPDVFDETEVKLLEELAGDLSFGIESTRLKEAHRKAVNELENYAALLRETGHIARVGGWEFDVETGKGTWTEEVARIHDMDPADTTSRETGTSFYHSDSKEKIEAAIANAIRDQQPYDLELELTTHAGTTRWVRTIGQPVVSDGKVVKLRGSIQDITPRKLAEKAREDAELRYRSLFDHAMDAVLLTGPDGTIYEVNQATCAIFCLSEAEIRKRGRNGLVDLTDPRLAVALQEREKNGRVRAELSMVRGDGSVFPADITSTIFTDSSGRQFTSMIIRDISERKQIENVLRNREDQYRFALRISQTGGWDLDLFDHTAHRTIEHDRIFGYPELLAEWSYEMFLEHVLPEDREQVNHLFEEAVKDRKNWSFICRIRRIDGEVRWIHASGEHQFDESGKARRMAGVVQDITDRKRSEELLRRTMNRLVETEEALKKEASRQLHDQVGQNLTALNLNMVYIGNQLQLLNNPKLDRKLSDSVHLIENTVEKIRDIMVDLRPSVLDDFGLSAALRWSSGLFASRSHLKVIQSLPDFAPRIPVNVEYTLYRMVQEALHNIVKHAEASEVRISLVNSQEHAVVTVQDNGKGFVLHQTGEGAQPKGLGLAGMRERMAALGGSFRIETSPGNGTRLTFTYNHLSDDTGSDSR